MFPDSCFPLLVSSPTTCLSPVALVPRGEWEADGNVKGDMRKIRSYKGRPQGFQPLFVCFLGFPGCVSESLFPSRSSLSFSLLLSPLTHLSLADLTNLALDPPSQLLIKATAMILRSDCVPQSGKQSAFSRKERSDRNQRCSMKSRWRLRT